MPSSAATSLGWSCLMLFASTPSCGSVAADDVTDAGPDAARDSALADDGVDIGSMPETETETGAERCARPLEGSAPFAVQLYGEADFRKTDGSFVHRGVSLDVYFPHGRVAGKPVVYAHANTWPEGSGVSSVAEVLTKELGTAEVGINVYDEDLRRLQIIPRLEPGDGDIVANVVIDAASSGDFVDAAKGSMRLCPRGDTPSPSLDVRWDGAPTGSIRIGSSVPWTIPPAGFTLRAGGVEVPYLFYGDGPTDAIVLTPRDGPFPPDLTVDVDGAGVHDVMNRPYASTNPPPLVTTARITDTTLATAPPAGAIAGATIEHAPGTVALIAPHAALLALPDSGSATTLRLGILVECKGTYLDQLRAALVTADGKATPLTLKCGETSVDYALVVPGSGPLWFSLSDLTKGAAPDSLPSKTGPSRIVFGPMSYASP